MSEPLFTIVDEKQNIIQFKKFAKIKKEDFYLVSALWIENSRGDILFAKRAMPKLIILVSGGLL